MWHKAGENFEKAEMYIDAVVAYKSGGLYEIAIGLMER